MVRPSTSGESPLYWIGSSLKDLRTFPERVQDEVGTALSVAQFGGRAPSAKPWRGLGSGVLEVVEDFDGNAYRAVYAIRFAGAVYVIHAFQKKSPDGIRTSALDRRLIESRLKDAQRHYEATHGKQAK